MDYTLNNIDNDFVSTYTDPEEGKAVLQQINDTLWEIHKGAFLKSQMRFFTSISNDWTDSSARRVVFGRTPKGISNANSFYIHTPKYNMYHGKNTDGESKDVDIHRMSFRSDFELAIIPDQFLNYLRSYPWNGDRFIFKFMYGMDGAWSKDIEGYSCMEMFEYVRAPDGFEYNSMRDRMVGRILSPFDGEQFNSDTVGSRYDTGYYELYMENRPEYYKLMKDAGLMSNAFCTLDMYNNGYLIDAYALSSYNIPTLNVWENVTRDEIEEKGTNITIRGIILLNPVRSIVKCVDYETYSKNIDYTQYLYDGCLYIENFIIGNVNDDTLELVCYFNKGGTLSDRVVVDFSTGFKYLRDIILLADYKSATGSDYEIYQ